MPAKRNPTLKSHSRSNSATKLAVQQLNEHSRKKSETRTTNAYKRAPHLKPALTKKPKPGFTLAADDEQDESDGDEWTSESGATTPSHFQDSEDDEEEQTALPRIDTARQSDYAESRPQITRHSSTRPSSTYSLKLDGRPHPLIRGQSFGQPRPSPLAPLTVKSQVSSSPPTHDEPFPGSPESMQSPWRRRTSISSARSVATLPTTTPWHHNNPSTRSLAPDRSRTMSSSSTGSTSSAAVSSLAFAIQHGHPMLSSAPMASPHLTCFFPPRFSVPVEKIHPLLPAPYMTSHLSVLANRTPIKESYDRVMRAKQNAR